MRNGSHPPDVFSTGPSKIPTNIHGSDGMKDCLKMILTKYIDVFSKQVRKEPAKVSPLVIEVDRKKWEVIRNRQPARKLGSLRAKPY